MWNICDQIHKGNKGTTRNDVGEVDSMTKEKRMKHVTKCTFCGKSDRVEYLGDLDWFCNKRCYYHYRHNKDN